VSHSEATMLRLGAGRLRGCTVATTLAGGAPIGAAGLLVVLFGAADQAQSEVTRP
jgi:hypothetical protein